MHGKDIRMRALDEMMNGIKTIKYNSYQEIFENRVKRRKKKKRNKL